MSRGNRQLSVVSAVRLLAASLSVLSIVALGLYAAPSVARADVKATPTRTYVTDGFVSTIVPTQSAIYIGGVFSRVGPRTGPGVGIDASTGRSLGLPPVSGGDQTVWAVAPDGAGGFYVGGDFTHVGLWPRRDLAHILANGRVDPGFNPSPRAPVRALAVSGPNLYVGGSFGWIDGQPRSRIAAVDITSGHVTSWDPGANLPVDALAVSGQTVYAGGGFTSIGGRPRTGIAALDAATGQATGWNPDARYATSRRTGAGRVYALAVAGQTVYAGGHFNLIGDAPRNRIAALDATTGEATSWNGDVSDSYGEVYALALAGHTLYAGGSFESIGGQPRHNIAALDAATGNATSWNPDAAGLATGEVDALAISGHTVYAGGEFDSIGGKPRNFLAGLDATSGQATSWDPDANRQVNALAISGHTVYAGGQFTSIGGQPRHNIAALNPETGAVTSWNPNANGWVSTLVASGQTIYAAGQFSSIGGKARARLAALDATTGEATSWNPGPPENPDGYPSADSLAVSGQTVYVGGYFTSIGGKPRNSLAAIDATTGTVTGWNPNPLWEAQPGDVAALSVSGQTVYAGGGFTSIGGRPRSNIAALDVTTGKATSWDPGETLPPEPGWTSAVLDVAVSGQDVYVGGYFASIGGQPRNRIAALDATTGKATSWNPNAVWQGSGSYGNVATLALDGSTVYAGGSFISIGGQPRRSLAALDATSGVATPWIPRPLPVTYYGTVRALATGPDGSLWVGGDFRGFPWNPQSGIARFAPVNP